MSRSKTERLDRLLSNLGYGSRKDVGYWIKEGLISVDDQLAKSVSQKVTAESVRLEGKPLDHPDGLNPDLSQADGFRMLSQRDGTTDLC